MACITNEPLERESASKSRLTDWILLILGFQDGSVLMLIPIFRLCSAHVGSVAEISETHAASIFGVGE
jgi:hypothetical protein